MAPKPVGTDVVGGKVPKAGIQRLTCKTCAERAREQLGQKCEDMRTPAHEPQDSCNRFTLQQLYCAMSEPLDCLIVGGGPAGLTAAIYLARFHLRVRLIDAGDSRASWIPLSHNHAGYPDGISGEALIAAMRAQAGAYGVVPEHGLVERIERTPDGFAATASDGECTARTVLLATGVENNGPPMDDDSHDRALRCGRLRYCPVCDGFEATDQAIAVLGRGPRGAREALFLRSYSRDVTLFDTTGGLGADLVARIDSAGITRIEATVNSVRLADDGILIDTDAGVRRFDTLYPALGSRIRSGLARHLGARLADDRCIVVDDHCRTGLSGLYAAGDVVKGLDQISSAMGQAAVAATAIRNDLAARQPLLR